MFHLSLSPSSGEGLLALILSDLLGPGGDLSGGEAVLEVTGAGEVWRMDWRGIIFLRNLLFLKEMSPDPSILTLYCLWGSTSTMRPVRSHLFALLPC